MNEEQIPSTLDQDDASVEALEDLLNQNPQNLETKKELSYALLGRFLFGTEDKDSNDPSDLERVRAIVEELPEAVGLWPRAYLAFVDGNNDETAKWLALHATYMTSESVPLNCDDLYCDFIEPFWDAPESVWLEVSEAMSNSAPESAAAYTMRAITLESNNLDSATSLYAKALEKDEVYWFAALSLAGIYANEKNWQSTDVFYAKALRSETAQLLAEIHFDYGWCLGKLKRYDEELIHFRTCLELDSEFEYARNNIGWSLFKQRKYQEALSAFEEAIEFKVDGNYPLHNKARTLKKLGRLEEALTVWRLIGRNKPNKYVKVQIDGIEHLLAKKEKTPSTTTIIAEIDIDDDEIRMAPDVIESTKLKPTSFSTMRTAAQHEMLLEETIERLIDQGSEVFGRKLRMYQSEQGLSGRQYIISDGLGRIDLLTVDSETEDLVVVELKRDESHEAVVGQISMYMQWVREHLARPNQKVEGIICVFSASPKLKLAARSVSGLHVFEYGLTFQNVAAS